MEVVLKYVTICIVTLGDITALVLMDIIWEWMIILVLTQMNAVMEHTNVIIFATIILDHILVIVCLAVTSMMLTIELALILMNALKGHMTVSNSVTIPIALMGNTHVDVWMDIHSMLMDLLVLM
jgi:hypothetical protein